MNKRINDQCEITVDEDALIQLLEFAAVERMDHIDLVLNPYFEVGEGGDFPFIEDVLELFLQDCTFDSLVNECFPAGVITEDTKAAIHYTEKWLLDTRKALVKENESKSKIMPINPEANRVRKEMIEDNDSLIYDIDFALACMHGDAKWEDYSEDDKYQKFVVKKGV